MAMRPIEKSSMELWLFRAAGDRRLRRFSLRVMFWLLFVSSYCGNSAQTQLTKKDPIGATYVCSVWQLRHLYRRANFPSPLFATHKDVGVHFSRAKWSCAPRGNPAKLPRQSSELLCGMWYFCAPHSGAFKYPLSHRICRRPVAANANVFASLTRLNRDDDALKLASKSTLRP